MKRRLAGLIMLCTATQALEAEECSYVGLAPVKSFPWMSDDRSIPIKVISDPVVAANLDGRLELFAIGPSGDLQHSWQDESSRWQGINGDQLSSLGTPEGVVFGSTQSDLEQLAVANGRSGLTAFVIGGGAIWRIGQVVPNGNWGTWRRVVRFSETFKSSRRIWAVANQDRRLELFALNEVDGKLYHNWEIGTDWSGFHAFGEPPVVHDPSFVFASDRLGRIVVAAGTERGVVVRRQAVPNSGWRDWEYLFLPCCYERMLRPAFSRNADGRLELVVKGASPGNYYHTWESAPGTWSGQWVSLHKPIFWWDSEAFAVGQGHDQCIALVSLSRDYRDSKRWLVVRQQRNQSADWQDWAAGGRAGWSFGEIKTFVIQGRPNRFLELFARAPDGTLVHTKQIAEFVNR